MYPYTIRAALCLTLIALLLGCQDKPPTPDRPGEEKGEADSGAAANVTPDQTSVGTDASLAAEPDAGLVGEPAPSTTAVDPPPNPLELPTDPSAAVLTYDWDNGSEADLFLQRSGDKMVIYADGRVVIHDPFGAQVIDEPDPNHVPSIEAQLPVERVQELVALTATPEILNADFSALREEMFEKHGEIADASSTSISIRTMHIEHDAYVYALGNYASETDSVPWLQMVKVTDELSRVRKQLIAAHKK